MPAEILTYGRGVHERKIEIVQRRFALGYAGNNEEKLCDELQDLRDVKIKPSPGMLLLDVADDVRMQLYEWAHGQLGTTLRYCTPILRDLQTGLELILTDEILIHFRQQLTRERATEVLSEYPTVLLGQSVRWSPGEFIAHVQKATGIAPLQAADAIDADEEVEFACPNFIGEVRRS